jgi:hypothetical protein
MEEGIARADSASPGVADVARDSDRVRRSNFMDDP